MLSCMIRWVCYSMGKKGQWELFSIHRRQLNYCMRTTRDVSGNAKHTVRLLALIDLRDEQFLKKNLLMFPPGLEPGTFRVLGERDNHYTTETLL